MKKEISQRLLRSALAQPREKPFEIYDTRLPGFGLRVQPSGWRSFFVRWGRNGRKTLGPVGVLTCLQARTMAEMILGNVFHGRKPDFGLRRSTESISLRTFIEDKYQPFAEGHLADPKGAINRISACFGQWFDLQLEALDVQMIDRWIAQRRHAGISASTVNRDLATLGAALNRAVRWGLLKSNPLKEVGKCRVDGHPSTRYLTTDERDRLLEALRKRDRLTRERRERNNERRKRRRLPLLPAIGEYSDHLTPMVLLSLHTGCRRGEMFSLTWDSVSFSSARLTIRGSRSKNGQSRIIALNREALHALREWRKVAPRAELVFPGPKGSKMGHIKSSWKRVLKDAEITGFRWHDLRHTFASYLVMAGVDLNTVRELMGHTDIAMTLRYAHLSDQHKETAVQRLCA